MNDSSVNGAVDLLDQRTAKGVRGLTCRNLEIITTIILIKIKTSERLVRVKHSLNI